MTFNEPIVPVEGGYLYNFHYPKVKDGKRAAQVAFHTMLANAKSIKEYKELLDMGIISKEEFEKKKKELLNL